MLVPLQPFLLMFLRVYLKWIANLLVIPLELFVLEDALVELVPDLVEVIHVELADEWRKVPVPKVNGQDLLLKPIYIYDDEVSPLLVPGSHVFVLRILHGQIDRLPKGSRKSLRWKLEALSSSPFSTGSSGRGSCPTFEPLSFSIGFSILKAFSIFRY